MYVIIQPRSLSNSSEKYRVVKFHQWMLALDGLASWYRFDEFDTLVEAKRARVAKNEQEEYAAARFSY
jgi:hypothetical protein